MRQKLIFLFILFFLFSFFAGCGGGGSGYDDYDDTGDTVNDSDSDKSDSADTQDADETPGKSDEEETGDDASADEDSGDTEADNDTDTEPEVDFWSTCEGIIACTNGCIGDDSECINSCYSRGSDDGQLYYRRWKECFMEKCAEDKTAECSAANCAEWDGLCNVASAFEHELTVPAPYGNARFSGDFSFILNNAYPTAESQLLFKSFVSGKISSMPVTPAGTIISFVRTSTDQRDGNVVEVYQVPYNTTTQTPGNPVAILRIKADSAIEGTHTVGVTDESEARLIIGETDSLYNMTCYHAFGVGSFTIDKAVIKTGSSGRLKISNGSAELFNPQNIPELGGDATEILGVSSCSLIY